MIFSRSLANISMCKTRLLPRSSLRRCRRSMVPTAHYQMLWTALCLCSSKQAYFIGQKSASLKSAKSLPALLSLAALSTKPSSIGTPISPENSPTLTPFLQIPRRSLMSETSTIDIDLLVRPRLIDYHKIIHKFALWVYTSKHWCLLISID